MFGADAAGKLQRGAEGLACPMKPDGEIILGQFQVFRHDIGRLSLKVEAPQQFRIDRPDRGKKTLQARTDRRLHHVHRRDELFVRRLHLLNKALVLSRFCSTGPIVICDPVAKNTIEPGDDALIVLQRMLVFDGFEETVLEQVFRDGLVVQAASQKRAKSRLAFHQSLE